MSAAAGNQFISINPDELMFHLEPQKQSFCDLRVLNTTENHVAFKVKTTSPKKYFVRPNTGVIKPGDSCLIRVSLQAQRVSLDLQSKDKFLLQSTLVDPNTDVEELSPDTFNKDSGKAIEECKLKVSFVSPTSPVGNPEDEIFRNSSQKLDANAMQALQQLKDERDAAVKRTQQLQQELELLKRRKNRRGDSGFTFNFAILAGIIGIMVGLLLKLTLSSTSTA